MTDYGFKNITVDNWLNPDKLSSSFARFSSTTGKAQTISGEDWVRAILKPKLDMSVPKDIQALFEVARGALVYGYFFYPLYTLAGQQLFRIAEAAVTLKCKLIGAPSRVKGFKNKIDYLVSKNIIVESNRSSWHGVRELRNIASHPKSQSIMPPGNWVGMLEHMTVKINSLFE